MQEGPRLGQGSRRLFSSGIKAPKAFDVGITREVFIAMNFLGQGKVEPCPLIQSGRVGESERSHAHLAQSLDGKPGPARIAVHVIARRQVPLHGVVPADVVHGLIVFVVSPTEAFLPGAVIAEAILHLEVARYVIGIVLEVVPEGVFPLPLGPLLGGVVLLIVRQWIAILIMQGRPGLIVLQWDERAIAVVGHSTTEDQQRVARTDMCADGHGKQQLVTAAPPPHLVESDVWCVHPAGAFELLDYGVVWAGEAGLLIDLVVESQIFDSFELLENVVPFQVVQRLDPDPVPLGAPDGPVEDHVLSLPVQENAVERGPLVGIAGRVDQIRPRAVKLTTQLELQPGAFAGFEIEHDVVGDLGGAHRVAGEDMVGVIGDIPMLPPATLHGCR